eukprot:1381642-Amphidinium_carterae.1
MGFDVALAMLVQVMRGKLVLPYFRKASAYAVHDSIAARRFTHAKTLASNAQGHTCGNSAPAIRSSQRAFQGSSALWLFRGLGKDTGGLGLKTPVSFGVSGLRCWEAASTTS